MLPWYEAMSMDFRTEPAGHAHLFGELAPGQKAKSRRSIVELNVNDRLREVDARLDEFCTILTLRRPKLERAPIDP